jgi:hypothetical protein
MNCKDCIVSPSRAVICTKCLSRLAKGVASIDGQWEICYDPLLESFVAFPHRLDDHAIYEETKECECGSDNPIGQGHSSWCELFESEF